MSLRNAAYIVDAVRTPVGAKNGGLAHLHPADLGAHVLQAVLDRTGVDPAAVDDVVMGVCDQLGPQAGDVARTAWLSAGLPDDVPGVIVDRQCGSSQQAVHFAAQAVMSGTQDVVLAGGIQNMSMIPIASALTAATPFGYPDPYTGSTGWDRRYGDQEVSQFRAAEMVAEKWGFDRRDMEVQAHQSHQRAVRAMDEGRFDDEIVPVAGLAVDECPRRDSSLEKMARMEPMTPGGRVTVAMVSQIADAAAVLMICSEDAVRRHGLKPMARIVHLDVRADDPIWIVTGSIRATVRAVERSGVALRDCDILEINEAFACVPMMWAQETGAPLERTNVNGSGISLGHPLGATGARIMTTMVHELRRCGGRFALQVTCEGGGQANVTIIERCP